MALAGSVGGTPGREEEFPLRPSASSSGPKSRNLSRRAGCGTGAAGAQVRGQVGVNE